MDDFNEKLTILKGNEENLFDKEKSLDDEVDRANEEVINDISEIIKNVQKKLPLVNEDLKKKFYNNCSDFFQTRHTIITSSLEGLKDNTDVLEKDLAFARTQLTKRLRILDNDIKNFNNIIKK